MKFFIYMLFISLVIIPVVWAETVVVDNGEASTSSTEGWRISGGANPYGDDSFYSKTSDATYSFYAELHGIHEVSLWWTEWPSRSTSVPVEIYDGDTLLDTVLANQTERGGQWNVLDTYFFNGHAKVVVVSEGSSHSTCADAVKFDNGIIVIREVTVMWDYPYDSSAGEAGFVIRVNESRIIDVPDPEARAWSGDVGLRAEINKFDMQTYDTNDNYSIWSEPAYYTPKQEIIILAPTDVIVTEDSQ